MNIKDFTCAKCHVYVKYREDVPTQRGRLDVGFCQVGPPPHSELSTGDGARTTIRRRMTTSIDKCFTGALVSESMDRLTGEVVTLRAKLGEAREAAKDMRDRLAELEALGIGSEVVELEGEIPESLATGIPTNPPNVGGSPALQLDPPDAD